MQLNRWQVTHWLWLGLTILLGLSCLLSVSTGPVSISLIDALRAVVNWATQQNIGNIAPHEQLVINNVRLPRTLLALAVGAILAQCGAVMQGLFRNPLADPGIIGVSSGAALGAAICIVLLPNTHPLMIPISAFVAGLITTLVVYRLASSPTGTSVVLLLLSGVAIAALAGAGIGVLTYLANDMALRDLTLWQMGSIAGAQWIYVSLCVATLVFISWRFYQDARALNALLLGEAEARHLGIDVDRFKLRLILLCALGVGVSVAATGIIGFIGLVVPHLVRMILGPDHRQLLPLSALLGATLLALADIGARAFLTPAELPVGLVTALLGAPFFIFLLLQQRSKLT
ncbi:iron ABC transporter permease [Shewanella sp. JNE10-2]|uniref:FecCD family ABC transporter permease n=1 Tax=unclassified Shewanella TaxID=196818 RepID=UPI0020066D9D|nr:MULTISPECIES: iron ABC transporter permease [unclassified Shewanella]MCK7629929.1 iron ABC transporter permease [Shewanella sp. JNE9-1]MCK7634658.1 iron ABC transporter permease [Shewanella sp. JNE17]MCK7645099.1 iron ABC transporter permease [Shewanella sp. JNE3-1]MCK7649883.1 iron ABC transporter permease [Shewanella sp. JNE8]MCK7653232.1 iron ABC transporter permease [Shewanella sp. JNE4-1]